MFMKGNFIQIKEASELLGVTKLTLRNWDKAKKLNSYRHPINNYRIYKKEDIDDFIKSMYNKPPSPSFKSKITNKQVYKLKVVHIKD